MYLIVRLNKNYLIHVMSKLPHLKPKQLIKTLKQTGFSINRVSGNHYILYKNDSYPPITVPYHNKDLKTGTLSAILKQAKISIDELIDLL